MNANLLFTNNTYTVPTWAKAEGMERTTRLNQLWKLNKKSNVRKHGFLRQRIASSLYQLANVIDERVEEAGCVHCKVHSA